MNPRFQAVAPSLIREINRRKKPGDIDLGLGEPVLRPEMAPLERALAWVTEHGCPYTANAGAADLREAVAAYVGIPDVIITHGSQEAVYVALRVAVDPASDEVLIVEPAYPAYAKICEVEGIPFRTVGLDPADGFTPRAEPVIAALTSRTRLVVLSSPCNPTGRVWPASALEALADALPKGCAVLSDEVYRELYYGDEPVSIARFCERTIVAGGLSKSHALTGLRLGWIAGPPDVVTAATRAHQLIATAASTFSQRAALEVLREGTVAHRAIYSERHRALIEALERSGLRYVRPEGAFYCLVAIPDGRASLDVALRLLEEREVVAVPGVAFGQACEGWLRLSWVGEPAAVAEGISRIRAFFME